MPVGLPLLKNVFIPLAKSVWVPFGLTTADSATDAVIQKKIDGSGMTTSVFSNKNLMKSLEKAALFIKSDSKTIGNNVKE